MNIKLQSITDEYLENAKKAFDKAKSKMELDQAKAMYLGPKSILLQEIKEIPQIDQADRAEAGKLLNTRKNELTNIYLELINKENDSKNNNSVDMSLPYLTEEYSYGHSHPTSMVLAQTFDIFTKLGFEIIDSDEVETDWYNFEALNMPKEHPARDMQDTFYI
ncbi:MAG: phenylalanyl-tRNA synthetase alpha chain, partial [Patescibacteria group bacterium]|nr:phenylalanyl-tRNA synthetase alpha chain [Patescibacteria group bacterium]